MNNLEQAKVSRNGNSVTYVAQNTSVFSTNLAFTTLVTKLTADNVACMLAASLAGADNKGFSQLKLDLKNAMAHKAGELSGYAQVTLELQGKLNISGQLHDADSFYSQPADAEAAARALGSHKLMSDNLTLLTGYVTSADLVDLADAIDAFNQADGSSGAVHHTSPALTAAFKSALKVTDTDIKNLQKLGKKYRLSNPTFYKGLIEVCKIPVVNIHHTDIDISLHDEATGAAIANATASLSNTDKTGTSDINGILHIEHAHPGNPTLTIICAGYKPFVMLTHIESGRNNSFTILLEKE